MWVNNRDDCDNKEVYEDEVIYGEFGVFFLVFIEIFYLDVFFFIFVVEFCIIFDVRFWFIDFDKNEDCR